jgi:hypothetical protein
MLLKCGVNQKGLKLSGQYQNLLYTIDVNLLGERIHTKKEKIGALLLASKEIRLEVNAEQAKYKSM